ncbi:MAG: hypothetical protein ACYS22_15525 [Planctomycetota bacterium]|jgi:hypothetical protein
MPGMRWSAVIASIIAGLGHFVLGRFGLGTVLFTLFAASLNGVLLSYLWIGDPEVTRTARWFSAGVALSVWLFAMAHVFYLAILCARPAARAARQALIREALTHYLQSDLTRCEETLVRAARRSGFTRDVDVLFLRGAIAARAGRRRQARRFYRQCRTADIDGKWSGEIARDQSRWNA